MVNRSDIKNALVTLICFGLLAGCTGRPAAVDLPILDSAAAAAAAIDAYDSDGDGKLSRDELAGCPGIRHALKKYDQDGDGQVNADEIATRIRQWHADGIGILALGCTVTLDGRPLPGAQVKLVPEPFLGAAIQPASGTTRDSGRAMLTIAPGDLPERLEGVRGVHAGLYRVEITHSSIDLPARYNGQTMLGRDVSQADQTKGLLFQLKTR